MPQWSGKIEAISIVADENLKSISQLDLKTLSRALSRKPTYAIYKTLLTYWSTLQRLNVNVNLTVKQADDALGKASDDLSNTTTALVNACNFTTSPHPTSRPLVAGEALIGTMKLQTIYQREKVDVLVRCRREQMHAQMYLQRVDRRVEKVERALVKKYGILTADDEGMPLLNVHNTERIIDVMASIPGIEDL